MLRDDLPMLPWAKGKDGNNWEARFSTFEELIKE